MGSTKRVEASILLDSERYDQLKAYHQRKGTEKLDDALTLVVNTGLSRIAALEAHASKAPSKERPKKEKALKVVKAKAAGKTKTKSAGKKKAGKKKVAKVRPIVEAKKPAAAAKKVAKGGAKVGGGIKVAKSGATVSRLAPQRPQPVLPAASSTNGSAATSVAEAAEA